MILVMIEHDRGAIAEASLQALTAGRRLADVQGMELHCLTIGAVADGLAEECAGYGATTVHQAHHRLLSDYGPETWGETLAQVAVASMASMVVAMGTDRGNEVLAQAAARTDQPMVANCLEVEPKGDRYEVVRVRWGGSLLERSSVEASITILTFGLHSVESEADARPLSSVRFEPELDELLGRSVITDRVVLSRDMTLATAPVVVGGGRGVGSAEGFAPLEELAGLLGGVVGCSRVVTNNGWRPHTDQVGQTGTRIAPEIYIVCGVSGAIQHWVGAAASKRILAINTDPEANMVAKADYAIIGDLHEVIPAISTEIKRRRPKGTFDHGHES